MASRRSSRTAGTAESRLGALVRTKLEGVGLVRLGEFTSAVKDAVDQELATRIDATGLAPRQNEAAVALDLEA